MKFIWMVNGERLKYEQINWWRNFELAASVRAPSPSEYQVVSYYFNLVAP